MYAKYKCNALQQLASAWNTMFHKILIHNYGNTLHQIFYLFLTGFSAATTLAVRQRALEGLPAAQRSRGSRVAEPLPMRCFRLLEDEGACLNVPHQAEEEAELMRRADRQRSTDTSPQRL